MLISGTFELSLLDALKMFLVECRMECRMKTLEVLHSSKIKSGLVPLMKASSFLPRFIRAYLSQKWGQCGTNAFSARRLITIYFSVQSS